MITDWAIALLIAVAVFLLVSGWRSGGGPELGPKAPDFSLQQLDGATVELDSFKGQTLVLNFWASWCGPCKREIPDFARFHTSHPDVAMLGVAVDSGEAPEVAQAAKRFGITWPVAMANSAAVRAYDVSVLPTTVIIGPDGGVVKAVHGTLDESSLAAIVATAAP